MKRWIGTRLSRRELLLGTAAAVGTTMMTPRIGNSATPKAGGQLIIGSIQETNSLFPMFMGLNVGKALAGTIFDSLVKIDDKGDYIPCLAKEVPTIENGGISRDGLTYTLHLRDDVKWHDGRPLTSADVRFTYEMIMNKENNIVTRAGWSEVETVTTPNPTSVTIRLKHPHSPFVFFLVGEYGYVVPKHLLDGKTLNTADFHRKPVGTGPFVFKEWVAGDHILLAKNPNYWMPGRPYLDSILYKIVPSTQGLLALAQQGGLQLREAMNYQDQETARSFHGYDVVSAPSYTYFLFWLNCAEPGLDDEIVRHALAYGLDKGTICKTILKGLVEPSWSPINPIHWAYSEPSRKDTYDPRKANAILDAAGWKRGADGVREKGGKRLAFAITNIAGDVERLQIVQVAQRGWDEIGIKATFRPVDAASHNPNMRAGTYQLAYGFWFEDYEMTMAAWTQDPNQWRYKSDNLQKAIQAATTTHDRAARKVAYRAIQEDLAEHLPAIYFFNRILFDLVSKRVQNYRPNPNGSWNYWNAHEWWLA